MDSFTPAKYFNFVSTVGISTFLCVLLVSVFSFLVYRKLKARRINRDRHEVSGNKEYYREQQAMGPNRQLYVGNLPYRARENDIHDFFEHYGEIKEVKIIRDRQTKRSKGFGFVTFVHLLSATQALELHTREYEGRALIVRYAKPAAQRKG